MLINDSASPWLLTALPAAGVGLSIWIARQSAGGRGLPGCGAGSGCDAVTRSRWSKWMGMPVAVPAALVYLLILIAFAVRLASPSEQWKHLATEVLLSVAPLLAAAAVWFIGLQWLLLRRFCLYCLAFHGIGTAVAVTIAFGMPGGGVRFDYAGLPAGGLLAVLSVAVAGAAALVLGQVLVAPKTFMVKAVAGENGSVVSGQLSVGPRDWAAQGMVSPDKPTAQRSGTSDPSRGVASPSHDFPGSTAAEKVPAPGENIRGSAALRPRLDGPVQVNPYLGRRIVVSGRVPLQCGVWPVIGAHDARDVLVLLFCYTCGNCRQLHQLLGEVMSRERRRVAVMMTPVPTDPGCNPNILNCGPEHADACAYARLALWVWKANWPAFAGFNQYLFDGERPPALAAAWSRAELLTGRALPDPRQPEAEADRLIGLGVSLHKSVKSDLTPTLLMPRNYVAGHVPTGEKLEEILAGEIGGATRGIAAHPPVSQLKASPRT